MDGAQVFSGPLFSKLHSIGEFLIIWHFGLINRNKWFEPYICLKETQTKNFMTLLTSQTSMYLHNVQLIELLESWFSTHEERKMFKYF